MRRGDPHRRPVEIIERLIRHDGHDLRTPPAQARVLLDREQSMGTSNRTEDSAGVERHERAHVDHLAVDPVLRFELLCCFERPRDHQRERENGCVLPRAHDLGAAKRVDDLAVRHLPLHRIERLVLEEDHGVGVADRGGKEADHIARVRGRHHLEPGDHHRPVLDALGMLGAEARARAVGGAHDQRAFELTVGHVPALADLVGDVVEAHRKEIGEHDLGNRLEAGHGGPHGCAQNGLLGDGTVAHALFPELLIEPDRGLEHAARLAHVLAEKDHVGVARHFLGDATGNGIAVGQFRHAKPPSA